MPKRNIVYVTAIHKFHFGMETFWYVVFILARSICCFSTAVKKKLAKHLTKFLSHSISVCNSAREINILLAYVFSPLFLFSPKKLTKTTWWRKCWQPHIEFYKLTIHMYIHLWWNEHQIDLSLLWFNIITKKQN